MKKTWIIVIAVVAVLVIYCVSSYNSLVTQEETVGTAWSNVENQYQRRSDLIPNLVNTVKGYAAHEKETFDAVVSARAKATQMTISIVYHFNKTKSSGSSCFSIHDNFCRCNFSILCK